MQGREDKSGTYSLTALLPDTVGVAQYGLDLG